MLLLGKAFDCSDFFRLDFLSSCGFGGVLSILSTVSRKRFSSSDSRFSPLSMPIIPRKPSVSEGYGFESLTRQNESPHFNRASAMEGCDSLPRAHTPAPIGVAGWRTRQMIAGAFCPDPSRGSRSGGGLVRVRTSDPRSRGFNSHRLHRHHNNCNTKLAKGLDLGFP